MFIANDTCEVWTKTEERDIYGKAAFTGPVTERCAVITFTLAIDKTSVRADSSGSRGHAQEEQGSAVVLFPVDTTISPQDIIRVEGQVLEVTGMFPRKNIAGILDHYEARLRVGKVPE